VQEPPGQDSWRIVEQEIARDEQKKRGYDGRVQREPIVSGVLRSRQPTYRSRG
jgi:hypothetical protein